MENVLPRGLRNHNPLNIEKNGTKWQGATPAQNDKRFVTFVSNAYGYRAAFKILRTYMTKGYTSIDKIIKRYAPPKENATENYIKNVCSMSGLARFVILNWQNKEDMVALVHAMAIVENGMKYLEYLKEDEIRQGYELAFGK